MGDGLNMPSVPSRLAAVCACIFALSLSTPALADKGGDKTPPPQPTGLGAPGSQSAGPGDTTNAAPQTQAPAVQPQSNGNGGFTKKMNKGKGHTSPSLDPQRSGGKGSGNGSSFTGKQSKPGKGASVPQSTQPAATTTTSASTPTPTTPAGGNTSAPTTPASPGGGSKAPAAKKHKTSRHSSSKGGRKTSRSSSGATAPRPSASALRPVHAVGVAPTPASAPPTRARRHEGNSHALARVRVSVVTRTVHDIVQAVPGPVKAAIGAMAALLLAAIAAWATAIMRARRLRKHRGQLLQEVGLLQAALLPEVPERIGPLAASVAYRPADGPGAGGDFYDVFQLEDGKVGLVLGDVAGHGRDALARTALLRYTLRAYLETGLEPRIAMRLAGETLEHDLGSGFATAAVALYDPELGTLTFSCAGHPPPILLGPPAHDPVTACSAPPIGVGERTGVRQTTVALPVGSVACFFTDGLAEARVDGELFGRERLASLIEELNGDISAPALLESIRTEVHHMPDDMAACVLRPVAPANAADQPNERIEELELREGGERDLRRFLAACGIAPVEIGDLVRSANARAADYGGAIARVRLAEGERPQVTLALPLVESLASAAAARS
jgi:stage II sporulation SpoE-like protein